MDGTEEFAAYFRHDDDLRRSIDDPMHYVALDGRRLGKHGVKCGHDRHIEAGQELDDVAPGLATENPVLMLKGNGVEGCIVQELGRPSVVADHFVADLEAHSRGIVVGATRVRHGDDASPEVRALCRDRQMQIVSKGSDPASTRKMIADERHTLKQLHFAISRRLLVEAVLARGRGVGS